MFFEQCMQWELAVHFQFLASQNTMAALIGGQTVHSWGGIPVNADTLHHKMLGKDADGDIDQLFLNAVSLRFLLIDEVSTISPALLGALDAFLR